MWMLITTIVSLPRNSVVIEPVILSDNAICSSQDHAAGEAVRNHIDGIVYNCLVSLTRFQANCGEGSWYQVVNLNMSDNSESCPPLGWLEIT